MDSATHLAAGVLAPLIFRKAPRTAALVVFGIAAGALPDIDIIAERGAYAMFYLHSSVTHSILAVFVFALLLALLLKLFLSKVRLKDTTVRVEGGQAIVNRADDWSMPQMFAAAFLGLSLHLYLDCMATFGTQILWPFSDYRVALSALFIVDFVLTIPLLLIMLYCLFGFKKTERLNKQVKWARYGLTWVIIYSLFCLGVQYGLSYKLNRDYAEAGTVAEKITIAPVLVSPLYWKAVAENSNEYHMSWVAAYKPFKKVTFYPPAYPKPDPAMWQKLKDALPEFREFDNFANFITYEITQNDEKIVEYTFKDLRYLYYAPNIIMDKVDSNQSMFIMQIRMGAEDRKIYAWRYLERGDTSEKTMWVAVRPPL